MNRPLLSQEKVTEEAMKTIGTYHSSVVGDVAKAVESNAIVVVGMAMNPFVKKARKALDEAKLSYKYLEFGSYTSQWKPRLAIKLWSGWPTYPQVFFQGKLVGGFKETEAMIKSGKIKA